jgi:hypothetical protein
VLDDEAVFQVLTKASLSVRQTSMISSAMKCCVDADGTFSEPIRKAAAPSPKERSSGERGAARRQSLATTRTLRADPALTASIAERSAVVPARTVSAKSAVTTSRRRSKALAMMLAPCFSRYVYEVEANRTPSI